MTIRNVSTALIAAVISVTAHAQDVLQDVTNLVQKTMGSRAGLEFIMKQVGQNEKPTPLTVITRSQETHPASGYVFEKLELEGEKTGKIRLVIRYPRSGPSINPRPVLFVMSGFFVGSRTLEVFGDIGENILVGYDYPTDTNLSPELPQKVVESIGQIPAQVASSLAWITAQPWVDSYRVNTIGISLGAIFLPLCQRIAALQGTPINSTIFAYGGAKLEDFLREDLKNKMGTQELALTQAGISLVGSLVDPRSHLPELRGKFLVVNGEQDELIPQTSSQTLAELTPRPKRVVVLPGPHIGPGETALIKRVTDLSMEWLVGIGAINPLSI